MKISMQTRKELPYLITVAIRGSRGPFSLSEYDAMLSAALERIAKLEAKIERMKKAGK